MENLPMGLVFLAGLVVGWIVRGAQRACLGEDTAHTKILSPELRAAAITDAEVLKQLRNGNKIGAIKRYRELTGQGLKESKDAIDLLS